MMTSQKKINSFIDINLCSTVELREILDISLLLKKNPELYRQKLVNKNIALLFFEPSTRTRVSFEVGINNLGGNSIILNSENMQLHRGESVKDTSLVLSKYVDLIVLRCLNHDILLEFDNYSTIPIINALTKKSHPCQVMADIITYEQLHGSITGKVVSWIGDNNNMLTSWVHASMNLGFKLNISTPNDCYPKDLIDWSKSLSHEVFWSSDPRVIVPDADIITTDSWKSMGSTDDDTDETITKKFIDYQINDSLISKAKKDYMFMHCLPAHIGKEVTKDVMEGDNSYVLDEIENKMYIQNAIILWCLGLI